MSTWALICSRFTTTGVVVFGSCAVVEAFFGLSSTCFRIGCCCCCCCILCSEGLMSGMLLLSVYGGMDDGMCLRSDVVASRFCMGRRRWPMTAFVLSLVDVVDDEGDDDVDDVR